VEPDIPPVVTKAKRKSRPRKGTKAAGP
jgi:hypothetical protein